MFEPSANAVRNADTEPLPRLGVENLHVVLKPRGKVVDPRKSARG
jgi:hypothetical protein